MNKKLCDICVPKQWKTIAIKQLKNTGFPVYGANGVVGYWDTYNHDTDTLLIGCRGTCGTISIARGKSYVNGNAMCLDKLSNEIELKYLYHFLKGYDFKNIISGSTIPQITIEGLQKVDVVIPTKEKQFEIISVFDKLEQCIENKNRQLVLFDELVKSRFIELFGDPLINEKGWTVSKLGEYMTLLTDFSSNGSYELLDSNVVMYDEPNYAIMVRTTDLESGNLSDGVKYIDRNAYELLAKSKIYGGELIMNKIGSAGKIYVMPKIDRPASLGRNAFMFRFDERLNMTYLYSLLTSDYGTAEIQQYVRGAVTKTITKESTRSIRIIVPPIALQEQFAAFVEQTDKSKLAVQQSLEKLETLKKALMQKYFG